MFPLKANEPYINENGSRSTLGNMFKNAGSDPYSLPTASAETLGGIKVGTGLEIDEGGVLSTSGGSGPSYEFITHGTSSDLPYALTTANTFHMWVGFGASNNPPVFVYIHKREGSTSNGTTDSNFSITQWADKLTVTSNSKDYYWYKLY